MKTVFTNGCFDILHVGHVRYLTEARALGDRLIVGLNSDASVRALKGPNRPINSQEARREMLLALRCVDEVMIFEENDPGALIERLRPDVHVKGGDYRPEDLPEAAIVQAYGGQVVILSYHAGYSTTGLVTALQDDGSV